MKEEASPGRARNCPVMETGTLCPPSLMTNSNRCFHFHFCDSFCIAAHAHSVSTHSLPEYNARHADVHPVSRAPGRHTSATTWIHKREALPPKIVMSHCNQNKQWFLLIFLAPWCTSFSLVLKKAIEVTPSPPRPSPTHAPLPHSFFRPRRASEGWMNGNQGALFVANPPLL